MKINCISVCSILILLLGCTNHETEKNNEIQRQNITETTRKFDYPCTLSIISDTLMFELSFDSTNYYSPLYVPNALDLLVKNISKDMKQNNTLKLITRSNQAKYNRVYLYNYNDVKNIDSVFNDSNVLTVFKRYIYKNIRQEKLLRFNLIVNHLLENMNNSEVKTMDYIDVVLKYSKECENPKLGDFYTNLLIEVRNFALSDSEWWPDFNPQDVDYFLNYCNRNNSKII